METDPHCSCRSATLESAGLTFCALYNISACSGAVLGAHSWMQLLTAGCFISGQSLCYWWQ